MVDCCSCEMGYCSGECFDEKVRSGRWEEETKIGKFYWKRIMVGKAKIIKYMNFNEMTRLMKATNEFYDPIPQDMIQFDSVKEYIKTYGVEKVETSHGEIRYTRYSSIVFPNGWVASICNNHFNPKKGKYSIAICDYDGYFDSKVLIMHGYKDGVIYCNSDKAIIRALDWIRNLAAIV